MKIFKIKHIVCLCTLFTLSQVSIGKMVNDIRGTTIPKLHLENAEIKDALSLLFKSVDVPYSVSSDIHGLITVNVENQPFELVLRSILNQVDATYKLVEGTYEISTRKTEYFTPGNLIGEKQFNNEQPGLDGKNEPVIRRIKIDFADPQLIWTLLNKTNADFKLRPETTLLQDGNMGGGFTSTLGGSTGPRQGFGSLFNK